MPRRALVVSAAIVSPPGTEKVTSTGSVPTSARAARIMRLGTGLIAGAPTGRPRPGLVMVPIPSQARRTWSPSAPPGAHLGGHAGAVRAVRVVAGVLHDHGPARAVPFDGETHPPPRGQRHLHPLGAPAGDNRSWAALAAADAQVPVVHPVRSPRRLTTTGPASGSSGSIGPLRAPRAPSGRARAARGFSRRFGADGPLARVGLPESATC